MDEATQISEALSAETFWEDGRCRSWSMYMAEGMSLEIVQAGSNWTWGITRPNRTRSFSSLAFSSVQETKSELRAELEHRRAALSEAGV